jgi:opacity protein-like surface antigen
VARGILDAGFEEGEDAMGRCEGGRGRVGGSAVWLVVSGLLLVPVVGTAGGGEPKSPARGRGFLFGASIGGGRLSFPGGEDVALALGPVVGQVEVPRTSTILDVRSAKVVRAGEEVAGAERVVPLVPSEGAGGFAMQGGYAFSRRIAVILDVGVSGGLSSADFNQVVGSVMVRLSPTTRFRVEAGPAFGDLGYGYDGSVVEHGSITGSGFQGVAGLSVLSKPRWSLDIEARYSNVGYDGFRATTVTFALGAIRHPAY